MTRGRATVRAALLALAAATAVAACGSTPGPVPLSASWPERSGEYEDVTAAWTRRAVLRGQYQQVLELYGTFRSPTWRAAYAEREARIRKVEGAARDALFAKAKLAAEGDYEIALVVTTYDRTENDLQRGDRSVWRLALVDDKGIETPPSSIVRDKRPLEVLKVELPEVNEFAEVYVATFPRSANVLRDDARRMTFKMWSPRGGVELAWLAP